MTQQITAQLLKGGLTVDASGNVTATGRFSGPTQKTGTIKAQDGTTAITIADSTGKVTLAGDLIVSGTTTTINSTTLTVDDKNIELGSVDTPSDTTADGGGITLKGATDKTILWTNSTDSWDFNQGISTSGAITTTGGMTITHTPATVALKIDHNGNERALYIDAENTTNTAFAINADAMTTGKAAYIYSSSSDTGTFQLLHLQNDNASATGATCLYIKQDSTGPAIITTGGNVGIGVTDPDEKLEVTGNIKLTTAESHVLQFGDSTSNSVGYGYFSSDVSVNVHIDSNNNDTSSSFIVHANTAAGVTGGEKFVVKDTGNVGIGTAAPDTATGFDSPCFEVAGAEPSIVLSKTGADSIAIVNHSSKLKFINDTDDRAFFHIHQDCPADSFIIDSSGRVTKLYQPSFQAAWADPTGDGILSAMNTSNATGKLWDTGDNFTDSGGKFTAPVDGIYYFNLVVDINDSNGAFDFYKNNGAFKRGEPLGYADSAEGWVTWGFSVMMDLDEGDYVQVAIRGGSYSAGNYAAHTGGGTGTWGWFEGYLLG